MPCRAIVLALSLLAWHAPAVAQLPLYAGFKAGIMDPDVHERGNALNLGVLAGHALAPLPQAAIEVEYSTTFDEGRVRDRADDWNVTTMGVYGAYRTPGEAYAKARLGLVYQSLEVGARSSGDSELSLGVGLGFRAGPGRVEWEYTRIESNLDFLSVGYIIGY